MTPVSEFWEAATSGGRDALALWTTLAPDERRAARLLAKRAIRHRVRDLRRLGGRVTELLVAIDWPTSRPPLSDHIRLEVAAARRRGEPLDEGEPVPGCGCSTCTGIEEDDPVRLPAWRRRDGPGTAREDRERRERWEKKVAEARRVSILRVASLLHLGQPKGRGEEVRVLCPFHADEEPSLRLNTKKDVYFCFVCDEGGDAIDLFRKAKRVEFVEAVEELSG